MANTNLSAAKSAKNDEFYTQHADIPSLFHPPPQSVKSVESMDNPV